MRKFLFGLAAVLALTTAAYAATLTGGCCGAGADCCDEQADCCD
ncbi:MAG: hypothetical protein JWM77_3129 [Rhodospirillales bacterium]|nr:hypothetical protein [Rhodospirillales bacterium]